MRPVLLAILGLLIGCDEPTETVDPTEPECTEDERDCAGNCFGEAYADDCGLCDADPKSDCVNAIVVDDGWDCDDGVTCQDVWQVVLRRGAEATLTVGDVTGGAKVRLGAFAPGSGASDVNMLVGTNKDLSCAEVDAGEQATFRAVESGTWHITVGHDAAQSTGKSGSYSLTIASDEGVSMVLRDPFQNDVPTQSMGARCGSEYRFPSGWQCAEGTSCQDVYDVTLRGGSTVDLSMTELELKSVAALGLYTPGNNTGDQNLLTNNRNERSCSGRDEDLEVPTFEVPQTGTYTVAATRYEPESAGNDGRYVLTISSDAFFERPQPTGQDLTSDAPATQCEWTIDATGSWDCAKGVSCQDVFDVELPAGTQLSATVHTVLQESSVRFAGFAPGEPLSGTNLYTGANNDIACWKPDEEATLPPFAVTEEGTYRFAVGRDAATSVGEQGSYELVLAVTDGYGGAGSQTADNVPTEAAGAVCP